MISRTDRNGYVNSGGYATVVCGEDRAVVDGAVTSYCIDGQWQAQLGRCANSSSSSASDCRSKFQVANADIATTNIENQYRIICKQGYQLQGAGYIYCFNDGTYTTPGTCQIPTTTTTTTTTARPASNSGTINSTVMCYSSSVDNGVISASSIAIQQANRYGHQPGSVITLKCNQGYALVGSSTATCRNDGYWNQHIGYCVGLPPTTARPTSSGGGNTQPVQYCYLPEIPHGTLTMSPSSRTKAFHRILPNTVVTLTCDDGYKISSGNGQTTCQQNGILSRPLGDCIPMTSWHFFN